MSFRVVGLPVDYTMSAWALHAKRKEPEEAVVELLRNVSLSPPKRVRVTDPSVPTNSWPTPRFEPEVETQPSQSKTDLFFFDQALVSPPPSPSPPQRVPIANPTGGIEDKPVLLYKLVNHPLFSGGSPTGPQELPPSLDASGALAACKGIVNNGFSVESGLASSDLANSSSTWTDLFEALDLQSKKPSLPTRRLQRTSSCSSLPRVASSMVDTSMEEEIDAQPGGQLTVIPHSSSTSVVPAASNLDESFPSSHRSFLGADSRHEMADNVDAMDLMEETTAGDGVATGSGTQFGSPIPTYGSTQWEPCDVFKAPYSKVMWSH